MTFRRESFGSSGFYVLLGYDATSYFLKYLSYLIFTSILIIYFIKNNVINNVVYIISYNFNFLIR
jgi:hypothetical protein